MSVAIVIPARYASTRYPGKPLVELRGADGTAKSLLRRSWDAAMSVDGIDQVVVATDADRIADAAHGMGVPGLVEGEFAVRSCTQDVELSGLVGRKGQRDTAGREQPAQARRK